MTLPRCPCGFQMPAPGHARDCKLFDMAKFYAASPQPAPTTSVSPAVWDLVAADMKARDEFGEKKYGTRLQPHNGRDALMDAYQEALDIVVYLRQALYERDGK